MKRVNRLFSMLFATATTMGGLAYAAPATRAAEPELPTVRMMVGGIDKQIYLPYKLADQLGFFKKYGVNMVLETEQAGGVGAEEAMVSGQVEFAGAWYVHTIQFQLRGKDVVDVVQLSGAPGEREMCATGSQVTSPADWAGKAVGVTDLGSGTDDLTLYLAARYHLSSKNFSRLGVGAGQTLISALKYKRIICGMTTQPTVNAIEKFRVGYSVIDLATTAGGGEMARWRLAGSRRAGADPVGQDPSQGNPGRRECDGGDPALDGDP